jgi:hypothetical protein
MIFKIALQYYVAFTAGTLLANFLPGRSHISENYLALMYTVAVLCYILQDTCAVFSSSFETIYMQFETSE